MTITKELKRVKFTYDFHTRELSIDQVNEFQQTLEVTHEFVQLSRIEMFSLQRFIVRVSQKGNPKPKQLTLLRGGE